MIKLTCGCEVITEKYYQVEEDCDTEIYYDEEDNPVYFSGKKIYTICDDCLTGGVKILAIYNNKDENE